MVMWFYQQLPIATVELNGETYPLYHLFHPTEHGNIALKQPATNGQPGMGVGALVERQEWFGDFNSKGAGRIIAFTDYGMTVKPEVAGLYFGEINHQLTQTPQGTVYHVTSIIGSDLPIIGPAINLLVRYKMFPPPMLKQWLRHQVEEVSSLAFFLPELYRASPVDNHYQITININD